MLWIVAVDSSQQNVVAFVNVVVGHLRWHFDIGIVKRREEWQFEMIENGGMVDGQWQLANCWPTANGDDDGNEKNVDDEQKNGNKMKGMRMRIMLWAHWRWIECFQFGRHENVEGDYLG